MKPTLYNAVLKLVGGQLSGSTDDYDTFKYHDGQTPPTKKEAEAKLAEMISDWDAQEYARSRQAEYPSVQELVVALYDTDDKSAVEAKRAAVKAKYPKPE